jgi:hypothetical protein
MESAYEYGSRVGFWRLMRVFAERQVILARQGSTPKDHAV